jgi:hypothetical protein
MSDQKLKPPDVANAESIVLRLFHCMKQTEQERLIRAALEILGERCSFDPLWHLSQPESIQQELDNDDLDSRMMSAWPASWPGQSIVELGNIGDSGDWLEQVIGNPVSEVLFGLPLNDDVIAELIADDYLREIRKQGFPLPSDFGDTPTDNNWTDDDERQVRADFAAFFRYWRERVLQALEKQNSSAKMTA